MQLHPKSLQNGAKHAKISLPFPCKPGWVGGWKQPFHSSRNRREPFLWEAARAHLGPNSLLPSTPAMSALLPLHGSPPPSAIQPTSAASYIARPRLPPSNVPLIPGLPLSHTYTFFLAPFLPPFVRRLFLPTAIVPRREPKRPEPLNHARVYENWPRARALKPGKLARLRAVLRSRVYVREITATPGAGLSLMQFWVRLKERGQL